MLGAIILSRVGFGPFAATANYPTPFEKTEHCLDFTETDLTLATSIAQRLLDRRPMIETLIKSAAVAVAYGEDDPMHFRHISWSCVLVVQTIGVRPLR